MGKWKAETFWWNNNNSNTSNIKSRQFPPDNIPPIELKQIQINSNLDSSSSAAKNAKASNLIDTNITYENVGYDTSKDALRQNQTPIKEQGNQVKGKRKKKKFLVRQFLNMNETENEGGEGQGNLVGGLEPEQGGINKEKMWVCMTAKVG